MESDGKPTRSSNAKSNRQSNDSSTTATKSTPKSPFLSACATKPHGKAVATSGVALRQIGKSAALSTAVKPYEESGATAAISSKRTGKAAVSSVSGNEVMFFRDVTLGPHEAELRFRLIHFWEARNVNTKLLIGEEMLLIDEEGHVIQGFIPAGRIETYLPRLVAGSVYQLSNFFGSKNKEYYRVADHIATVSFSWNSSLSVLDNIPVQIPDDRFRFHSHEEFQANCDKKRDLYDFLGHIKLVNNQSMTDHPNLDKVAIAETRQVLLHVQTEDGPVIKLYLWDQVARDFCQKFKTHESTPRVVLVTTVNPKQLGGTLALGSMSSSRVFMDTDVEPTRNYLSWLGANEDIANRINAEVVTKPEIVTIGELFSYIKQEGAKVVWFECTAVIDDVVQGSSWYYISCSGCNTKATKGRTSLICNNPKCKYLTRISVYDKSEHAVFVILGDAGLELTGKHAAELVASHVEATEDVEGEQTVPVPQALLDCIGKTYKFVVKVSERNFSGHTQSITVTRVLPPEPPQPIAQAEEDEAGECAHSLDNGDSANDRIRKASEVLEADEAKRGKSG